MRGVVTTTRIARTAEVSCAAVINTRGGGSLVATTYHGIGEDRPRGVGRIDGGAVQADPSLKASRFQTLIV